MTAVRRVLVVEDDRDIREAIRDILLDEGYEIDCAENGQDGIDRLRGGAAPSLILLDLMMPVKDGFQFQQELVLDTRLADIPIVVMSADGQVVDKKKRIGAKAYLKKPVDIDVLLETVRLHIT